MICRPRTLAAAALLFAPSIALAQRGARSEAAKHTEMMAKDEVPKGPALRVRDIEDLSPLRLLLDKRKDLSLTDAQQSQLKDAEGKLKDKNAPSLKAVDSLLHDMRMTSNPTPDDKTRARNANSGLMNVLAEVRANYDASGKDAVALLTPDQQTKATELLTKQREEADKTLREKLGGGGRGH